MNILEILRFIPKKVFETIFGDPTQTWKWNWAIDFKGMSTRLGLFYT